MRNVLLAAMATMGLVGCVGGINDMGTGDDTMPPPAARTARQMFDQDVYTVLKADCGGCHTATATPLTDKTYFVGATADIGYDTATKYTALVSDFSPSDAPILTKIAAGHNNLTYTTDQLGKITTWLNQEVSERTQGAVPPPSPPGTPPPTTESAAEATTRVLKQWTGCMTLTNFNTANMAQAWGNMNAQNNSTCEECHTSGGQGFVASQLVSSMWNLMSQHRQYLTQYFAVDLTGGTTAAKVIINTVSFTQVGTGIAPHTEHPRFNPTNNQGMTALKTFFTSTDAARTAVPTTCGTPTLLD